MVKLNLLTALMLLVFTACSIEDENEINPPKEEVPFVNGTTLVFVSQEEGQKLMGNSDEYSQALTKFDIASRTQNPANSQEQQYLAFAGAQAQRSEERRVGKECRAREAVGRVRKRREGEVS